jgi:hypothetical protein
MGRNIVYLSRRQFCDGSDVVEQCEKATHV